MTPSQEVYPAEEARTLVERLQNRAALLDFRSMAATSLRRPMATFTFDDFPASAYESGGRILETENLRGTYFVSGEFLGRRICGIDYYTENHLRAAHAAGHEIGCHSFTHEKLSILGPHSARKACDQNARFIRDLLGQDVAMTSFAYPFGDVSVWAKHMMAGRFAACRGVREALNAGIVDRAHVRITSLESRHLPGLDLRKIIAKAKASNGWIVFLSHEVSDHPSPFGTTPNVIEHALRYLREAGIEVLPFREAAAQVFQESLHHTLSGVALSGHRN